MHSAIKADNPISRSEALGQLSELQVSHGALCLVRWGPHYDNETEVVQIIKLQSEEAVEQESFCSGNDFFQE
jgi:hypothetical protein